jgi:alpha-tubulin suppressor-like RCC1 family protein
LEANSFLITDQGTLEGFGIQSSATSKALGRNGVNGYNPPGAVSGWPATNTVRNIKGDHSEACAVLDNNDLWCWGKNDEGELGDGTGSTRLTPVGPVASNVKKMYLGGDVHCYLDQSNQAYCVGEGSDGELGNGTNASSNTYGPVTGLSDAVDMAVIGRGDTETICAIRLDQTVWCWGLNTYGQVGDATTTSRNTPTQVSGLTDAIKLTGGRSHFCALKSDGTVWCWGRNDQGQLGDGTKVNKSVPVQVQDSSGAIGLVSAIGTGEKHNCVLKTDGSVWCWGDNPNGQLGDATTTDKTTAINYGLGANPAAIGIKVYFDDTCMVTAAGDAYCSGRHSGSNATSIFISF